MLQLARIEDREALELIAKQVHAMHVAWRPDIYDMPDTLYSAERFHDAVKQRQLYVAKHDDQLIGYVHLQFCMYDWPGVVKRKVLLLDEIAVREDWRNMGIGSTMMDDVKALAKAFGCTDLQLGVYPQNDEAISFYQKNGLTIRSIEMQMKL